MSADNGAGRTDPAAEEWRAAATSGLQPFHLARSNLRLVLGQQSSVTRRAKGVEVGGLPPAT